MKLANACSRHVILNIVLMSASSIPLQITVLGDLEDTVELNLK